MKKILIIGGGFFGMYLAEYLAKKGCSVTLLEKEADFMQRASYVNQARVHNGYHYPRSILTALRSRISFPRFVNEFHSCVDNSFSQYYMIPRLLSKISAKQFELFCHRIGAYCEPAPYEITKLVDSNYIDAIYTTKEYAFDSVELKNTMKGRLDSAEVSTHLNKIVTSIYKDGEKLIANIASAINENDKVESIEVDHVFNCTYSMINNLISKSSLELIPLKHEMTEMALVKVPDELKNIGITVMDGPFFSFMPFPARKLHSCIHVRYTPHYEWRDTNSDEYMDAHKHYSQVNKKSAYRSMIQDAKRFIPILSECEYESSIWGGQDCLAK